MTQLDLLKRNWIEESMPKVKAAIKGLAQFSPDLLHDILPEPQNKNWFGVLIARMKALGMIERCGYAPSLRAERNGSVVGQWREIPLRSVTESVRAADLCKAETATGAWRMMQ